MDFLAYVEHQRQKLPSDDYPNIIWNIINNYETREITATVKQEYRYHLPIDLRDFLKSCIEKVSRESIDGGRLILGEQIRVYLLTFVHWCLYTEEEDDFHLLAAELYIHVICLRDNVCFKGTLYKKSLSVLEAHVRSDILSALKQLKCFLSIEELELEYKEATLDLVIVILENTSSSRITDFDTESSSSRIDHEALLCLKVLALKEHSNSGLFVISMALLSGLRSVSNTNIGRQSLAVMQTNLRTLIKDLHPKILNERYSGLKNALLYTWTLTDFEYHDVAVSILNDMDVESYQSMIEKLRNMIISKDDLCKKNLMRLSHAILSNQPQFYTEEKLDVLFQTLVRSIIMNCGSSNTDVCNTALEVIDNLCYSKNDRIDKNIKVVLESTVDMINKRTFLKRLTVLVDPKWKNRARNRHICNIVCYLATHFDVEENFCIQVIKLLAEEATPYDLRSCLYTLSTVFVKMTTKGNQNMSQCIFSLLYKMATHPSGTSSEFVKHLYNAILYPHKIDGHPYDGDIFLKLLISEDYNFDELFKKCDSLGLLKPEHVKKIISELHKDNEHFLKLLCSILEYVNYTDFVMLTDFIFENFEKLVDQRSCKYMFYALNKILTRRRASISCTTGLDKMNQLKRSLEFYLKDQRFPAKVISNAISLLKVVYGITGDSLSQDLVEATNNNLLETLTSVDTNSIDQIDLKPILYAAEMALLTDYIPPESYRKKLDEILKHFSNNASNVECLQKCDLWSFCLILQTALAMKLKDIIDATLRYLRRGIRSKNDTLKLTSMRLLYDISNVILRNFESLIEIMFLEISEDSPIIIKKTCIGYIEKLVRDEYLRLNTSQYIKFVCLLREQTHGIGDYMKKLLSENFIISHQSTIARNFVFLIVHLNQYKKHSIIQVDKSVLKAVQKINQTATDKEDMYAFLFRPLTKKSQFNVLKEFCNLILDKVIEETLICDTGYWEMINDVILVIKIMSSETHSNLSEDKFQTKTVNSIEKNIIDINKQFSDKPKYLEHQAEIKQITHSILKLLFYNESGHFLGNIKQPLFDAIIHWTHYLLPDIVHLVHEENSNRIKMLYSKIPQFYKKEILQHRNR